MEHKFQGICFGCGEKGCQARDCPKLKEKKDEDDGGNFVGCMAEECCKSCGPNHHIFQMVDVSEFCVHAELEGCEKKAESKDDEDNGEANDDSASAGWARHFGNVLILHRLLALQIVSDVGANHSSRGADCESVVGEPHALGGAHPTSSAKKTCVVMISSAESENHADSNAASEIKFETMLLDEMVLHPDEHQEPALLHNDNLGALHLAKNQHVSPRTKHIQMREYFVREMQADGTLEMRCKKSENLIPDLFTKNLPEHDHSAHTKNL